MTDNERLKWFVSDYKNGGETTMCEAELSEELLDIRKNLKEAVEEIWDLVNYVPECNYDEGYHSAIITVNTILNKHISEKKTQ